MGTGTLTIEKPLGFSEESPNVGANDQLGSGPSGFTGATFTWRSARAGNDHVFELRRSLRHGIWVATTNLNQSRRDELNAFRRP